MSLDTFWPVHSGSELFGEDVFSPCQSTVGLGFTSEVLTLLTVFECGFVVSLVLGATPLVSLSGKPKGPPMFGLFLRVLCCDCCLLFLVVYFISFFTFFFFFFWGGGGRGSIL